MTHQLDVCHIMIKYICICIYVKRPYQRLQKGGPFIVHYIFASMWSFSNGEKNTFLSMESQRLI